METCLNLRNNALKMMSPFSSTYTCQHIVLRMEIVKSKTKTRLTDILVNSLVEDCIVSDTINYRTIS